MKILLDECVPRKLANYIIGHEVRTVTQCGWSGLKNGELLSLAQENFDVMLTVDQNIPSQQQLTKFSIGVLIICSKSNDLLVLQSFIPEITKILAEGAFTGVKFARN